MKTYVFAALIVIFNILDVRITFKSFVELSGVYEGGLIAKYLKKDYWHLLIKLISLMLILFFFDSYVLLGALIVNVIIVLRNLYIYYYGHRKI